MVMFDGMTDSEWSHTSAVMALLANCHRDTEKRPQPFMPDDFNPRVQREEEELPISAAKEEWKAWCTTGAK